MFHHICVFVHDIGQDGKIIIVDNRVDLFAQGDEDLFNCIFNFLNFLSGFDCKSFKIDKEEILRRIVGQPFFQGQSQQIIFQSQ